MANKKKVDEVLGQEEVIALPKEGTKLPLECASFIKPVRGASSQSKEYWHDQYCEITYCPDFFNMVILRDRKTGNETYVPIYQLAYCVPKK